MDDAVLKGILIFIAIPASCLALIVTSFWIKRRWVRVLMRLPSALVLLFIALVWWALRGLAGIKG